jgi:glycosyltransferase involved in cell wall biosynthesis
MPNEPFFYSRDCIYLKKRLKKLVLILIGIVSETEKKSKLTMNSPFYQTKVSVIIPTYNRAELLRSAIESALKQTFTDYEIIVSDDRSTDHTREVVKSFKDKRIKYLVNKSNMGPSATRNSAILASKGEYIAFLDDDDEWIPEKLQKQVELLDKSPPKICGVYSDRLIIDRLSNKIVSEGLQSNKVRGNLLSQLAMRNQINTCTVLVRKRCLDEVGLFDETISYMEDRDLWIRLSLNWGFEYINEPLTRTYVHKQGHLSARLKEQIEGREKLLTRYTNLFNKDRKTWSKLHLLQGAQYCQLKDMKKGRNNIVKGIKIYPFNFNAYFHLLSALLGANAYQRLRKSFRISI